VVPMSARSTVPDIVWAAWLVEPPVVVIETVGAVVSIVTASPAEAALVLPAMSVCLVVRVWLPLDNVELVIDQLPKPSAVAVPRTVVPLVSNSVTVAPASAPLPLNTGVVLLVMLSVSDEPESEAAVMSGADGAD